jgi:hypothetical protein
MDSEDIDEEDLMGQMEQHNGGYADVAVAEFLEGVLRLEGALTNGS